jgi:hypothetical protein
MQVSKTMLHGLALGMCAGLATSPAQASCGSAFCSINTAWDAQGIAAQPGTSLDLRYEFIKQDQLRAGSSKTSVDTGEATEIRTINRNLVASLDYAAASGWGVTASLPLVARSHEHVVNDTQEAEAWNFTELGDMRVVGRYQFPVAAFQASSYGISFGAKLPTGRTDVANADNTVAERALQPGSGSTDLIVGGFYRHALAASATGWFAQGTWQHAVASHDGFEPGDQVALNAGMHHALSSALSVMLQLNMVHKEHDAGVNAEPELSGGSFVSLSPGVSYAVTPNSRLYGFVQTPVYQHVRGTQLTADWTAVLGFNHIF